MQKNRVEATRFVIKPYFVYIANFYKAQFHSKAVNSSSNVTTCGNMTSSEARDCNCGNAPVEFGKEDNQFLLVKISMIRKSLVAYEVPGAMTDIREQTDRQTDRRTDGRTDGQTVVRGSCKLTN